MALIYGLHEANHRPAEPWWSLLTLRHICMVNEFRGCLLRLPRYDRGKNLTGVESRNRKSCMGTFPRYIESLTWAPGLEFGQ